MAEWSNALVLKTSEGHTSGGSNPSFSAEFISNSLQTFSKQCFERVFLFSQPPLYSLKRVSKEIKSVTKMKTKVSILFYAKNAKANTSGLIPIYLRITIKGKRIESSTGRFVEKSK